MSVISCTKAVFVAGARNHHQTLSIFVLTFLLGWPRLGGGFGMGLHAVRMTETVEATGNLS